MSLIFKPKINFNFGTGKLSNCKTKTVKREIVHWSTKELNKLTDLKALGLTYIQIGKLLGRSANSCGTAMFTHDLKKIYKIRREKMIEDIINA